MLGGTLNPVPKNTDDNPGPGQYGPFPADPVPGFRIELPVS